jgi:hypothetical protein
MHIHVIASTNLGSINHLSILKKMWDFPIISPEHLGFPYKNPMNMVVFPLHSHENVGFPKLFSMSFFLQCGFSHRATRGTQDLSHFDPGDPRIRDEGQGAKI